MYEAVDKAHCNDCDGDNNDITMMMMMTMTIMMLMMVIMRSPVEGLMDNRVTGGGLVRGSSFSAYRTLSQARISNFITSKDGLKENKV